MSGDRHLEIDERPGEISGRQISGRQISGRQISGRQISGRHGAIGGPGLARRAGWALACMIIVACVHMPSRAAAEPPPTIRLFDGRSFAGWNGDTERVWRIEDGAIVAGDPRTPAARNEFLATDREFEDFELRYEYRIDGTVKPNAGVQFRSRRIPDHHEVIGYQADIGPDITGALYDESRRNRFLMTPPEGVQRAALGKSRDGWHAGVVRCEGPRIRISVNGVETVDYTEPDPTVDRRGMVALQIHGQMVGLIRYRNIEITELVTTSQDGKAPRD